MSLMNTPLLCEFCAQIDFEFLRNPTADDLRQLNRGEEVYGAYPFRHNDSEQVNETWQLGRHSRVVQSAQICPLCAAVLTVLDASKHQENRSDLFQEDPNCCAHITWSAALLPPMDSTWRSQKSVYFYLRRMSLTWRRLDSQEILKPGRITREKAIEEDHEWARIKLDGCFQTGGSTTETIAGNLFQDDLIAPQQEVFGGRIRPSLIDLKLPKRWLEECLNTHGEGCQVKPRHGEAPSYRKFRLVDVNSKAIVEFHDSSLYGMKYVALSYVWGASQKLLLRKTNQKILENDSSLDDKASRSIQDAMEFASRMGILYLWVDALCILQDDDEDKAYQISIMSAIYRYALLTIVAGSGTDAEVGLPGLCVPRTAEQVHINVKAATEGKPPIHLMTTLNPRKTSWAHYAQDLAWSRRGWTLQEKVLSRRVLTFTGQQLFWTCRNSHWWEETFMETNLANTLWYSLQEKEFTLDPSVRHSCVIDDPHAQVWYQLQRLIRDFGRRKLSEAGDALDAFSAILEECTSLINEPFLWGIPASARFELGLCWEPYWEGLFRRTTETTLPMTSLKQRVKFPSWSWIGWEGSASLRIDDRHVEEGIDPQIVCYVLRNTPLRLVRVSRITSDTPKSQSSFRNPAFIASSPFALTLEKIYAALPEITEIKLTKTPDDQLLFFWSESSRFRLSPLITRKVPAYIDQYSSQYFDILDTQGEVVGQTATCQPADEDSNLGDDGGVEFISIADNRPILHPAQKIVLLIKRQDGIAYRVNIAEIQEEAWKKSNPSRVLVALG